MSGKYLIKSNYTNQLCTKRLDCPKPDTLGDYFCAINCQLKGRDSFQCDNTVTLEEYKSLTPQQQEKFQFEIFPAVGASKRATHTSNGKTVRAYQFRYDETNRGGDRDAYHRHVH